MVLTVIKLLTEEVILFPDSCSCDHLVQRLERYKVCSLEGEKKSKIKAHPNI